MKQSIISVPDIVSLVSQGESNNLEFKKSTAELYVAGKTLGGLWNYQGGYILLGVTDDGKIIGQDVSSQTRQDIANLI